MALLMTHCLPLYLPVDKAVKIANLAEKGVSRKGAVPLLPVKRVRPLFFRFYGRGLALRGWTVTDMPPPIERPPLLRPAALDEWLTPTKSPVAGAGKKESVTPALA